MLKKHFDLTKSEGGWMIASTSNVDRDKDRVLPFGADLTNFSKNPLLIFGHNYSDPWSIIGRAAETMVDADGVRFRPELREAANETDPMNIIRLLWEQDLLRAASIGFNPIEWKENEFGGKDFTRWELLEISLVPIPANADALRLAAKAVDDTALESDEVESASEAGGQPVDAETDVDEMALLHAIQDFIVNIREVLNHE
jgi:HK97 family phage prohead protease